MVKIQNDDLSSTPSILDLVGAARLVLKQSGVNEIVIDCSKIHFVRSVMLTQLIRLHLDARRIGKTVTLENASDVFLDVLTVTRLDRVFNLRTDEPHELPAAPHFKGK